MFIDEERLKGKREAAKIRQIDLANECGLNVRQVQRYEARESKPTIAHLLCIARVLNVSHLWLLGLTDNEQQIELRPDQLEVLQAYEAGDVQAFARLLRKKRAE